MAREEATYYPQSLLDIMTKEELDELVRDILADPSMVNSFIKALGPGASSEAHEIWRVALDAFVGVRNLGLDSFERTTLSLVVYDRFRMQTSAQRFHVLGRLATPSDFRARQSAGPTRPVLFVIGHRLVRPFQNHCVCSRVANAIPWLGPTRAF